MKPVLKKELPFASVGSRVVVTESIVIGYKQIKVSDDSPVSCNVSNDCVDDWVEEAKPREWWVVVDCQGGLSGDWTRLDQEQAERIAEYDNHHPSMDLKPYRAIKVREIIE